MPESSKKTGQFKKGKSGNPGGRPKLTPEMVELREAARAKTAEALQVLIDVMSDAGAPSSARVTAASEVLDRGWGRAPATIEGNVKHTGTVEHRAVSEIDRRIGELLGLGKDRDSTPALPN